MQEQPNNIPELLTRAITFWRWGQNASGEVSWMAYCGHPLRVSDVGIDEVRAAWGRSDYLAMADAVQTLIVPLYGN